MNRILKTAFWCTNALVAGAFGFGYLNSSCGKKYKGKIDVTSETAVARAGSNEPSTYIFKSREQHISEMAQKQYDMLVVGGGCHGAGVFLDGVTRGLSCALIDMNDFSAGCSSRSSKMAHGGLRYLAALFTFQKNAARDERCQQLQDSIAERTTILENAYYLGRKIPIVIPAQGLVECLKNYCGLLLFHLVYQYSQERTTSVRFDYPKIISREKLTQLFPHIGSQFKYGLVYEDGQFHDARLNLEIILTGTLKNYLGKKCGGNAANYLELKGLVKDQKGRIKAARVEDRVTKTEFEIKTKTVVNCAGNWTDQVHRLDDGQHQVKLEQLLGKILCASCSQGFLPRNCPGVPVLSSSSL